MKLISIIILLAVFLAGFASAEAVIAGKVYQNKLGENNSIANASVYVECQHLNLFFEKNFTSLEDGTYALYFPDCETGDRITAIATKDNKMGLEEAFVNQANNIIINIVIENVIINSTDTIAPEVKILSPEDNSKITYDLSIIVNATDNFKVKKVVLQVAGLNRTMNKTASSWNSYFSFDELKNIKGSYTIEAIAYDYLGNAGRDIIAINIEPEFCGNNIIEAGEQCDGSLGASCRSLGFDSGSLNCLKDCTYNTSSCNSSPAEHEKAKSIILSAISQNNIYLGELENEITFSAEENTNYIFSIDNKNHILKVNSIQGYYEIIVDSTSSIITFSQDKIINIDNNNVGISVFPFNNKGMISLKLIKKEGISSDTMKISIKPVIKQDIEVPLWILSIIPAFILLLILVVLIKIR